MSELDEAIARLEQAVARLEAASGRRTADGEDERLTEVAVRIDAALAKLALLLDQQD